MTKRYLTLGECIEALDVLMPIEKRPDDIINGLPTCKNLNKTNKTCKTGTLNVNPNTNCPFTNNFKDCVSYISSSDSYDTSNKDLTYKDHALEIRKEDEDIAKEVLPMPFMLSLDNEEFITADPVKVVPILVKIIQCLVYHGHYHSYVHNTYDHIYNCYHKHKHRRRCFHEQTCRCDCKDSEYPLKKYYDDLDCDDCPDKEDLVYPCSEDSLCLNLNKDKTCSVGCPKSKVEIGKPCPFDSSLSYSSCCCYKQQNTSTIGGVSGSGTSPTTSNNIASSGLNYATPANPSFVNPAPASPRGYDPLTNPEPANPAGSSFVNPAPAANSGLAE